ncbi:Outer membrane protein (porin) [Cupriavidus sp. YR651]|uniref:porin n=1 Tax=Cupriavidus sp. YR651 TaxID=1855315 RepID=UPI0008824B2D|nr:porin [Cupriavidus sp. YR651]SDD52312.1 Outer membrane protein (porin) [Cupriavidus sp. YR651]
MKRSILASAVLIAASAHAQSSVTLYGVVDVPIEYVNHMARGAPTVNPTTGAITQQPGGSRVALSGGGGLSGSRWGLRGVEDLGGGLQALFVLESGFTLDDGKSSQGGRLFGRQAYLGLQDARFGKLTFGRQYTTMFDLFANFSPTGYATLYEPVVAQLGTNFRSDNTAKYSAKLGDVTAEAHWSFGTGVGAIGTTPLAGGGAGETPGNFRDNAGYGAGVAYNGGPFGMAIAYDQWNPAVTVGNQGTARKAGAAASYAFGPAKLMAGYRWGQTKDAAGNTLLRDDYYWIGANYQVTPALGLTAAYYYDNLKTLRLSAAQANTNLPNPWQASFIADYNFSKRTDVYLTVAYSKNSGLNFDTSAISFANGYFLSQGNSNQFGAALGIRHKF